MFIVTWKDQSVCAICHDRNEALQTVKNLLDGDVDLDDIVIYETTGDGKKVGLSI
jgi:hypothetical protein